MNRQSSQPSRRRKYTQHQQDQARADAETLGTCAAARKHGIPESTVSRWRSEQRRSERAEPKPKSTPESLETATPKRKVARRYTPSEKAQVVEYARKHGVTAARDLVFDSFTRERDAISNSRADAGLVCFIDKALEAERQLERHFWLDAAAEVVLGTPPADRRSLLHCLIASVTIVVDAQEKPQQSRLERHLDRA